MNKLIAKAPFLCIAVIGLLGMLSAAEVAPLNRPYSMIAASSFIAGMCMALLAMSLSNMRLIAGSATYMFIGFMAPRVLSMAADVQEYQHFVGVLEMFGVFSCAMTLWIIGMHLNQNSPPQLDEKEHA